MLYTKQFRLILSIFVSPVENFCHHLAGLLDLVPVVTLVYCGGGGGGVRDSVKDERCLAKRQVCEITAFMLTVNCIWFLLSLQDLQVWNLSLLCYLFASQFIWIERQNKMWQRKVWLFCVTKIDYWRLHGSKCLGQVHAVLIVGHWVGGKLFHVLHSGWFHTLYSGDLLLVIQCGQSLSTS